MTASPLLAGALVGAIVAVVGWWVAHFLTLRRERDKVRREILSKDIESAVELIRLALNVVLDYHLQDRSKKNERQILILFERLGQRVTSFPLPSTADAKKNALIDLLINFKIAATKHHFEDEHTGALEEPSEQLALCQHQAAQLENGLLQLRFLCYEPLPFIVVNKWSGDCFADQQ